MLDKLSSEQKPRRLAFFLDEAGSVQIRNGKVIEPFKYTVKYANRSRKKQYTIPKLNRFRKPVIYGGIISSSLEELENYELMIEKLKNKIKRDEI